MGRRLLLSSSRRHALLVVLLLAVILSVRQCSANDNIPQQQQQQNQQQQQQSTPPPVTTATATGVITLNSKNFDSSLRDGNLWLIEFYAPWCSHCVRFASTYEQLAIQLHALHDDDDEAPLSPSSRTAKAKKKKPKKRKVNVAKVDGDAERALSSRFGVAGFPSFFLVDGWTVHEFTGNRSKENLMKFALEEYKEIDPVPFLFGPFGPMGQLKSMLMRIGVWLMGLYENLTVNRGMKPLMAMSVLCVGGLVVGLVSITVLGLMLLPKAKLD